MGPGPLPELVVTSCDVVVTGPVAVVPASVVETVVSSLIVVVVSIVVPVTGADVELVDGGLLFDIFLNSDFYFSDLVLPGIGRSPQFT